MNRELINGACVCKNGYIESSDNICKSCPIGTYKESHLKCVACH